MCASVFSPPKKNTGILASANPYFMEGIVIISGTGFIIVGYSNGRLDLQIRAGGWGPLLGDTSSGYAIGEAVLRVNTHTHTHVFFFLSFTKM